jgi:hypothetical protein
MEERYASERCCSHTELYSVIPKKTAVWIFEAFEISKVNSFIRVNEHCLQIVGPTLRRDINTFCCCFVTQCKWQWWNWNSWLKVIFTVATVYLMMLPVAHAIFVGWWDYSLITNWREFGRKRSWANLRYHPGVRINRLRKTTGNLTNGINLLVYTVLNYDLYKHNIKSHVYWLIDYRNIFDQWIYSLRQD